MKVEMDKKMTDEIGTILVMHAYVCQRHLIKHTDPEEIKKWHAECEEASTLVIKFGMAIVAAERNEEEKKEEASL